MKKGFTLIELLAVMIVIAILTLVAVPQLLKVVRVSKQNSAIETMKNYVKGLEDEIVARQFDGAGLKNGCYIVDDGVLIKNETTRINPNVKGEAPSEGWVIIKDDTVASAELEINSFIVDYDGTNGKVTKKDEVTPNSKCSSE